MHRSGDVADATRIDRVYTVAGCGGADGTTKHDTQPELDAECLCRAILGPGSTELDASQRPLDEASDRDAIGLL